MTTLNGEPAPAPPRSPSLLIYGERAAHLGDYATSPAAVSIGAVRARHVAANRAQATDVDAGVARRVPVSGERPRRSHSVGVTGLGRHARREAGCGPGCGYAPVVTGQGRPRRVHWRPGADRKLLRPDRGTLRQAWGGRPESWCEAPIHVRRRGKHAMRLETTRSPYVADAYLSPYEHDRVEKRYCCETDRRKEARGVPATHRSARSHGAIRAHSVA